MGERISTHDCAFLNGTPPAYANRIRNLLQRNGNPAVKRKELLNLLFFCLMIPAVTFQVSAQDVSQQFRNLAKVYRPMVRWWWPGGDVHNGELRWGSSGSSIRVTAIENPPAGAAATRSGSVVYVCRAGNEDVSTPLRSGLSLRNDNDGRWNMRRPHPAHRRLSVAIDGSDRDGAQPPPPESGRRRPSAKKSRSRDT